MKSLKFSCPDDLRDWIETKAEHEDISISDVVRRAVRTAQREDEATELDEATA